MENWIGFYKYNVEGYTAIVLEKIINFRLFIINNEGIISGYCEDDETINAMGKSTINGFIEGSVISFIKQYPFYYEINETGDLLFNKLKKHPPIHYSGEYDLANKKFIGTWEIEIPLQEGIDSNEIYLFSGYWEMRLL